MAATTCQEGSRNVVTFELDAHSTVAPQHDHEEPAAPSAFSTALQLLRTVPPWPEEESVVRGEVVHSALHSADAQAFIHYARWLCISERCAKEVVSTSSQPFRFWFGYVANTVCPTCLCLLVYTWHFHDLGAPFLMTLPGLMAGVLLPLHGCGVARWGPASLAWSWLGISLIFLIICGGSFSILACLFVPDEQMLFGNRFARVLVSTILTANANSWSYVSIPRVDGVTTSFAVAMGWHSLLRGLRFADCISDLEISGVLFRQAESGLCAWTDATQRCDLYVAIGVGNLICGLLDFAMSVMMTLFGKFLRSESRRYKMINASIHLSSLGLELIIFGINLYYTFAIAPLNKGYTKRSLKMDIAYYVASLILTVISCGLNLLGAKLVLAELRKAARSAVTIVQKHSGSASALWRATRSSQSTGIDQQITDAHALHVNAASTDVTLPSFPSLRSVKVHPSPARTADKHAVLPSLPEK